MYLEVCVYNAHLYIIADRTVLYHIDLSGKLDPNILFGYHNSMDNFSEVSIDEYTVNRVLNKYRELKGYELNNNKIYENNSLREDPIFEKYISVKATDGASFYFMNATNNTTPFIPIFSGLPLLSKGDSVKIELYDCGMYNVLVRMIIYKKKLNNSYDLYYKILDVNRPIRNSKGELFQ
jgi:hypothetical protein